MENKLDKMIKLFELHNELYNRDYKGLVGVSNTHVQVCDCRDFGIEYQTEKRERDDKYKYELSFIYNGVEFLSIHKEL